MQKPLLLIVSILAITHGASHAASGADSKFEINPVVVDSRNGTGSTVGIEYKVKGVLLSKSFDSKDFGGIVDPSATIGSALIEYSANGTIAASKDRNPKNFLEFQLDAKLRHSDSGKGTILGGLFAKYETNQSFDNKQLVYGLGGIYGKYAAFSENDFIAFDANYGRVESDEHITGQRHRHFCSGRHIQNIAQWKNQSFRQPTMSEICRSLPSRRHARHGDLCKFKVGIGFNLLRQAGTLNADVLQVLPDTSSKRVTSRIRTVIHNRTRQ